MVDYNLLYDAGKKQFSIAEAALYCQLTEADILDNEDASNAFLRGRVDGESIARGEILKAAENGDINACKKLLELAEKSRPEIEDDNADVEETE